MLCSSGFFCFATKNESACFNFFYFLTPILTVDVESQRPFAMSTHFRFEYPFTAAISQVTCLSTMSFTTSKPWFQATQNDEPARVPKMSGATHMVLLRRKEQSDEILLIDHTPGQWLPTAFVTFAIFRGHSQIFSSYESGCFVCIDRIAWKNDGLV